jgi:hypothetical protein
MHGASPFYNLFERICRYARLFLACIVVATLVVSALALVRSGMYTATAQVLLSDKEEQANASGAGLKSGADRSKSNLLGVLQKDPEFIKAAIRSAMREQTHPDSAARHVWPRTGQPVEYHFDPALSGAAFEAFCARAGQSIRISQRDGNLEIACRWPDRHAADIVNAFYWAFHDEVVKSETAESKFQSTLLTKLLADNVATERRIEQKLLKYRTDHAGDLPAEPEGTANRYATMLTGLADLQASIIQLQERRDAYAQQIKTIPPKIQSMEIRGRSTDTPLYLAAMQKRNEAQQNLDTLKSKYQDKHPKVQEAQQILDAAEAQFKKAEQTSSATPNIQQQTTIPNPEYDRTLAFINQADADLKGMHATLDLKQKQADDEKRRVLQAGASSNELKWLTDERASIRATRTNLEAQLQAAQIAEQKETERASRLISLASAANAVPDAADGLSLLIYAAGPVLGLIIAFVLSFVAQNFDRTLRTPMEVEKSLGKPVLAVLPKMDTPRMSRTRLNGGDNGRPSLPSG